jgi:hypothetical protein
MIFFFSETTNSNLANQLLIITSKIDLKTSIRHCPSSIAKGLWSRLKCLRHALCGLIDKVRVHDTLSLEGI